MKIYFVLVDQKTGAIKKHNNAIEADKDKKKHISEFIFAFSLNSFPHSNVPEAGPSISPVISQSPDAQAAEFLRHFRFDSAISDFPMIAPSSIGEILAEHRPGRIIIAFQIVCTNKLKGSRGSLGRATSLGWLELDLMS